MYRRFDVIKNFKKIEKILRTKPGHSRVAHTALALPACLVLVPFASGETPAECGAGGGGLFWVGLSAA